MASMSIKSWQAWVAKQDQAEWMQELHDHQAAEEMHLNTGWQGGDVRDPLEILLACENAGQNVFHNVITKEIDDDNE